MDDGRGNEYQQGAYEGMTLRDYIATQALTGIIACFRDHRGCDTPQKRVQKAFEYADLMLAERDKCQPH